MPLYEVNCNLCSNRTLHQANSDEHAQEKHAAQPGHLDAKKQWDELVAGAEARLKEFTHGKEHNA
jgi:hypothetical protein